MSTITTRQAKGARLTHNEVDANFTNLNTDKVEKSGTDPVVINVSSASDALRVTQTGAGNALVVEDSANPDSTPVVIDSVGVVVAGHTASVQTPNYAGTAATPTIQTHASGSYHTMGIFNYVAGTGASSIVLNHSRSGVSGTHTSLNSGDAIGFVQFNGSDGTGYIRSAYIGASVDTTPDTNAMPGRLMFATSRGGKYTISSISRTSNVVTVTTSSAVAGNAAVNDTVVIAGVTDSSFDGTFTIASIPTSTTFTFAQTAADASSSGGTATVQATAPTERMRIDSAGRVGFNATPISSAAVRVNIPVTGNATSSCLYVQPDIKIDVTTAYVYHSFPSTQASSAVGGLHHYLASPNTFSGTVTSQYGFHATATLTGATNNYGFYSNIAPATGRWAFYDNGGAASYFKGDHQFDKTVTAGGTTGAQTINKNAGSVNFAASATSLVVTNSRVTTSSIIIATVATNDSTMKSVQAVAGSGSFTLYANAAATAETRVNFLIIN